MAEHTPTPWFVHETKHKHYLGGEHIERRIFTVAIHPQLKDHDSVVSGSVGLGPEKGGPATNMVWMSEDDAAFIVKACNAHEALVKALQDLSKMYSHAWDRVDGGLMMHGDSIERFESVHHAAQVALHVATGSPLPISDDEENAEPSAEHTSAERATVGGEK